MKHGNHKDITGKAFGKLTAVKLEYTKNGASYWRFECDCGNTTITRKSSVLTGETKSCGCIQKEQRKSRENELIGKTFGKLQIIKDTGRSEKTKNSSRVIYLVQCECGNQIERTKNAIRSMESCGCNKKATEDSTLKILYDQYKHGAQDRNLAFELGFSAFKTLVKLPCHYCNSEPKVRTQKALSLHIKANGIDRIDNSRGYHSNNCVSCCSICNKMKSSLTRSDFLKHIKNIFDHSGNSR